MFDNEQDQDIDETGDSGDENSRGHVGSHDGGPMSNGPSVISGLSGPLGALSALGAHIMLPGNAQGLDLSEQHNNHHQMHHPADVLEKLKMQVRDIKVDRVSIIFFQYIQYFQ